MDKEGQRIAELNQAVGELWHELEILYSKLHGPQPTETDTKLIEPPLDLVDRIVLLENRISGARDYVTGMCQYVEQLRTRIGP